MTLPTEAEIEIRLKLMEILSRIQRDPAFRQLHPGLRKDIADLIRGLAFE